MTDKLNELMGAGIFRLGSISTAHQTSYKRKIKIKNIDLSQPEVDHEKMPATAQRSRDRKWTPLDIDFDGPEIPKDAMVEVTVALAGAIEFQKNGFSITTASSEAQPYMELLDNYKKKEAVFFVKNVKGIDIDFNIGVVFSKSGSQWELPVFIDPKIHNNGGG